MDNTIDWKERNAREQRQLHFHQNAGEPFLTTYPSEPTGPQFYILPRADGAVRFLILSADSASWYDIDREFVIGLAKNVQDWSATRAPWALP